MTFLPFSFMNLSNKSFSRTLFSKMALANYINESIFNKMASCLFYTLGKHTYCFICQTNCYISSDILLEITCFWNVYHLKKNLCQNRCQTQVGRVSWYLFKDISSSEPVIFINWKYKNITVFKINLPHLKNKICAFLFLRSLKKGEAELESDTKIQMMLLSLTRICQTF